MEGTITRVTYYNADTGYAVLRVRATRVEGGEALFGGGKAPAAAPSPAAAAAAAVAAANAGGGIAVVGKNLPPSLARKGAVAAFTGAWKTHAKFGAQLEVQPLPGVGSSAFGGGGGGSAFGGAPSPSSPAAPPSTGWVERGPPKSAPAAAAFLAGAGLPGVGPAIAARIVEAFSSSPGGKAAAADFDAGAAVTAALDAPDAARALARSVKGLSAAKAAGVKAAWDASRGSRALDAALRAAGAPPRLARALAASHGPAAPALLAADPYAACDSLPGASWKAVEALAVAAGSDPGARSRGGAALAAVVRTAAGKGGHTCVPWPDAERAALRLMGTTGRPWPVGAGGLAHAARAWCDAGRLVVEAEAEAADGVAGAGSALVGPSPPPALSSPPPPPPASASPLASASFASYLERRVRGIGPGTAGAIVVALGPAGAAAVFGGAPGGAARVLTAVPGVGAASAARFKARWDANERRLPAWSPPGGLLRHPQAHHPHPTPAAPAGPLLPPPPSPPTAAWPPPHARVFTPDLHAAEAGAAAALAALSRGRAPGAGRVRPGMVEGVLASLDAAAAATAAAVPGGPPPRRLSDLQRAAVTAATTGARLLLLTGGPGTGKTAATAAVVAAWKAAGVRFALAAPTGRAAARLAEAAGAPATTIHRLLDVRGGGEEEEEEDGEEGGEGGGGGGGSTAWGLPPSARPRRRGGRPGAPPTIPAEAVLVDEASLLDTPLAAALLAALAPGAQLVLVGDPDQLPPVGPGAVLEDVSAAAAAGAPIPRIVLAVPFRQGDRSAIVAAAAEVHAGRVPGLVPVPRGVLGLGPGGWGGEPTPDAWWGRWGAAHPPEALRVSPGPPPPGLARGHAELATVLTRLLPRLGFDPRGDVQVLTPVRAGSAGTAGLNAFLQSVLNPPPAAPPGHASPAPAAVDLPGGGLARVGDRVMQTVNDREADVCNGDVGVVVSTGPGSRLSVAFTGGGSGGGFAGPATPRAPVVYDGPEALGRLDLAWAATVHKAQGSEAPAAVLFLDAALQARPALTRRLLYTALTRARRCVVVVGDDASIAAALAGGGAVGSAPRKTGLRGRLRAALGGGGGGGGASARPPADPPLAAAA